MFFGVLSLIDSSLGLNVSCSQAVPMEALSLELQLSQYPLFSQLTAQAQAQLLSDLHKQQQQQQALPQGIRLITLPSGPDGLNHDGSNININISSVRRPPAGGTGGVRGGLLLLTFCLNCYAMIRLGAVTQPTGEGSESCYSG